MEKLPPRPMRRANPELSRNMRRRLAKRAAARDILAKIDPYVQQERFLVECYFNCGSKDEALRRAGYVDPETGQLDRSAWARPSVLEYQAERQANMLIQMEASADRILAEMTLIGLQNIRDYTRRTEDGLLEVDLSATPDHKLAAITEMTTEVEVERGDDGAETGRRVLKTKIKLVGGKREALLELGKRLGVFERERGGSSVLQVTMNIGAPAARQTPVLEGEVVADAD